MYVKLFSDNYDWVRYPVHSNCNLIEFGNCEAMSSTIFGQNNLSCKSVVLSKLTENANRSSRVNEVFIQSVIPVDPYPYTFSIHCHKPKGVFDCDILLVMCFILLARNIIWLILCKILCKILFYIYKGIPLQNVAILLCFCEVYASQAML